MLKIPERWMEETGTQSRMSWHPLKFVFFQRLLASFLPFVQGPVLRTVLTTILLNFWLYWIKGAKPWPLLFVVHPVAVLRKSWFLALKWVKGLSRYQGGGDQLCLCEEFTGRCLHKLLSFLYGARKPRGCFGMGSEGMERQVWLLWCPSVWQWP